MNKKIQPKNVFWALNLCFWASLFICAPKAQANHLDLSNVAVEGQNFSSDTLTLQFNISWNNSWRDSVNYDAAWIFIKYSTDGGATWNHATLKNSGLNPAGFSQGTGTPVDLWIPSDKKGCFIQRSSQLAGTVSASAVQLVWDYAADGISDSLATSQDTLFKIFGIEMVYVPQGGFYAGDGSDGTDGQFEFGGASSNLPGAINSESGLSFGNSIAQWYYNAPSSPNAGEESDGASFELSASYPKGFQAFYAMKYEISEGQWVSFFNTLTTAQKLNRDITGNHGVQGGKNSDLSVNRNTVSWSAGDANTARPDRACSFISWEDLVAYADWAALRPMSELEYEKICRGTIYPLSGEYAWGSTSIIAAAVISGSENGSETISTGNANAHYSNLAFSGGDAGTGPHRVGIYATSGTVTRVASGSGYYGAMELSGNLYERAATLGNAIGRGFSGTHGDGALTSVSGYEGNATNSDWPGIDGTSASRGITTGSGAGSRGGAYSVGGGSAGMLSVSDRRRAALASDIRSADSGGRCVRTAV